MLRAAATFNTDPGRNACAHGFVLVNNNELKPPARVCYYAPRTHASIQARIFDALSICLAAPRGRDLTGRKLIVAATPCRTAERIFVIFQRRFWRGNRARILTEPRLVRSNSNCEMISRESRKLPRPFCGTQAGYKRLKLL